MPTLPSTLLKPLSKFTLGLAVLCLTAGCFEERIVVQVNKQGSGVVEHGSYQGGASGLSSLFGGGLFGDSGNNQNGDQDSDEQRYDDAFFAQQAQKMGEGVSVKSWQLASNESGFSGYRAYYEFKDINTLNVQTAPIGDKDDERSAQLDSSALEAEHRFTMQDGKLTVHTPEPESREKQERAAERVNDNSMRQIVGMIGSMFRGARVSIEIEGLDQIKQTNARHHNDNRVTLMDVRLDELISDPDLFNEIQSFSSLNREEAQALADRIDGVDVDTQAEITIQF